MITGVAIWICNCGLRLKVVTETDKANIDRLDRVIVTCPKCSAEQPLYAHRIISVTIDRSDLQSSAAC
jgi:hypothetical protein